MSVPNYYAGNPMNRLSYLRHSPAFLSSALASPKARFILYHNLNPLASPPAADGSIKLKSVAFAEVKEFLGAESGEIFKWCDDKDEKNSTVVVEGSIEEKLASIGRPAVVFLGVDERSAPASAKSLPLSKPTPDSTLEGHSPYGVPYFALDVSELDGLRNKELGVEGATFVDMRAGMAAIPNEEAALAGEGRALIDWNKRNVYCPACARKTRSLWGGWKRACVNNKDVICASKKGVQNYNYPRTDPVVIMAVLDPTREFILLGRQKSWPKKFYSCLAGFIESGESIEEAVRREVYEEAGVEVEEVIYHSSQPWPYPSSLMIGCIGIAKESQTIRCDLDNELEDAHYFSRASVLAVINGTTKPFMTRAEVAAIDGKEDHVPHPPPVAVVGGGEGAEGEKSAAKEGELEFFRMPPKTAIANTLIVAWAKGESLGGLSK